MIFNGKEKDYESGFHYYGARYYWSEVLTGWLSVDPMMDKYPSSSPYNYCAWNPVMFVDPDGREKLIYFDLQKPTYPRMSNKMTRKEWEQAKTLYEFLKNQYGSNVRLSSAANNFKDNDDVIHLFAHGTPEKINLVENGRMDAKALKGFLSEVSEIYKNNIKKGKTSLLILHSCQTGQGENSIGQQLSESGELLVIAPSENVLGADDRVESNGTWNVFYKGKLVGKYKGDIDFQKQLKGKDAQRIINFWKNKYHAKYETNHSKD